jgi:tetratricopeptide (TPR) repeat protein
MPRTRFSIASAALVLLPLSLPVGLVAQVQQGTAARTLVPATTNAAAVTELRAAFDRDNLWSFTESYAHARRALELEPSFGLARAVAADGLGGPTARAEYARAVTEAAGATAAEALITLAWRENSAGRNAGARKIAKTAADLVPDDPAIAVWYAQMLPDTQRTAELRSVVTRFPDYPGAHMWLSYWLTPPGQDSTSRANADEAMRAATKAAQLAPNESGTHTALAHVLTYTGRTAEAKQHLDAASRMTPRTEYIHVLRAQLAGWEGNMPAMRASFDSAAAVFTNIGQKFQARRLRAFVALSEGNLRQTQTELAQLLADQVAINARGEQQATHLWMAYAAGAARDSAAVEQHVAAMLALDTTGTTFPALRVIAYSVAGNAAKTRGAFTEFVKENPTPTGSAAIQTMHRYAGMTLLAERKPAEALVELRQSGDNPFSTLSIIEALKMQGKTREANAERDLFFQRHTFSWVSAGAPIIRYRARR